MTSDMYEKRKNDQPHGRYPQWALLAMLIVGLLIGSIVTTAILSARTIPVEAPLSNAERQALEMTATSIINQATIQAVEIQATSASEMNEFAITATYIIDMATATAQAANP
ncbi:MAG: hypothetical protein SF123_01785 [Chloroflexota bacterium]|nr:hypothetical protein [Chloroflexota bacterium]